MDKEHARFVLSSFRPDGADARDPDFAGALHLAAEDRELGEWLAEERARDAEFSAALGSIAIPEDLRDSILSGFAMVRGEYPQAHDELDRSLIGALVSVAPPPDLRGKILAAMAVQAEAPVVREKRGIPWFRFGLTIAAAAGVALAFFVTRPADTKPIARISPVRMETVPASFITTYQSPAFKLEQKDPDHEAIFSHLRERALPCPCCHTLPPGLQGVPSLGCRELLINGKRGSLICFNRGDDPLVHLIVFKREDIEGGNLPTIAAPRLTQAGNGWSAAMWTEGDQAFVLMGKLCEKELAGLF